MYRSRLTQLKNERELDNDLRRLSARNNRTAGTRTGLQQPQQPTVEVTCLPRNPKNLKKKVKVSNELGTASAVSGAPTTTTTMTMNSARTPAAHLYTKKFYGRSGVPNIMNLHSPLPMTRKDTTSPYEQPIRPKQTVNSNATVSSNMDNGSFQMPIKENKSYAYLCKSVKKHKPKSVRITTPEISTTDELELVPLMQQESNSSHNPELSSARLYMNVRELLERKHYDLAPDELDTIKNVVKTDTRHRQLKQDDELFRDILRTQLEEIRKQEALVKQTLMAFDVNFQMEAEDHRQPAAVNGTEAYDDSEPPFESDAQSLNDVIMYTDENSDMFHLNLDGLHDTQDVISVASLSLKRTATARKHLETILDSASNSATQLNDLSQKKLELEYVYRNLPTLQREIRMLQSIGEELASSLKTTSSLYCSATSRHDAANELSTRIVHTQRPVSSIQINLYAMVVPQRQAQCFARVQYLCYSHGIVEEFRIEQKSLNELNNTSSTEDSDWIYIPVNGERTELKRTSFKRLKENPEMLLQYLKQRSAQQSFNLTEPVQMLRKSIMNGDKFNSESTFLPEAGDACSMRAKEAETILKNKNFPNENTNYNNLQCNPYNSASKYQYINKYGDSHVLQSPTLQSTARTQCRPTSTTTAATALQQIFLKHLLNKAAEAEDYYVSDTSETSATATIKLTTPKAEPNNAPQNKTTATALKADENYSSEAPLPATSQTSTTKSTPVFKTKLNRPSKPRRRHHMRSKSSVAVVAQPKSAPPPKDDSKKILPQLQEDLNVAKKHIPCIKEVILVRTCHKRRRTFTPIRVLKSEDAPESISFRTIIVCAVQMIVLLVLIMAFTYPDVLCLK